MSTATPVSQPRTIQVYFLAAPEDQSVCEEIMKHLRPIVRTSALPIEVSSDFNIPSGADREQYKGRLLNADIVLALISVDFIDNDDIYNRNQRVIERHNQGQTVMIPILVRNFMWKATPFVSLPVLPKNLQPLNNKQFWNSPDDAVMAVVNDIYDSINSLAQRQRAVLEPFVAETAQQAPNVMDTAKPASPVTAAGPIEGETVKPAPVMEDKESPVTSSEVAQPTRVVEVKPAMPKPAVQPAPAATSQSQAASHIAADWRQKYYTTVALKRAGAILLDQVFVFFIFFVLGGIFGGIFNLDLPDSVIGFLTVVIYFVLMPMMESSKWQGTIGKRILKLQITDKDGERITFMRAFWRNIVRSAVLYLYVLTLGLLLIVQYLRFNKTRKLFQDELSGTVIGERLARAGEVQVAVNAA